MINFETGHSKEKSTKFSQLSNLMGQKAHIEGSSSYGAVYINKWPNDSIEVSVFGINGVITKFTISEGKDVKAEAERPARMKDSPIGGGIVEHQYLTPEFSMEDLLSSFKGKAEDSQ